MTGKISEMPAAGALDGTEEVPMVQGGANVRVTAQAIADLATPSGGSGGEVLPVNPQTGTSYTLVLTDAPSPTYQGVVTMDNTAANAVTVPPNSSVAFSVGAQIQVVQLGAGQTSVAAGAGVTIHSAGGLSARAQYSSLILTQVATDVWVLGGDFA